MQLREDHHNAMFRRPDTINETLYVVTPVFNPQRYRARWKHYTNFQKHIIESGAHLVLIEATFGERADVFVEEVAERHTIIHVQVSHLSEIWIKENMINVAIQHLPRDWKYVAWIDADISFVRPDWVGETLHQLQHYHIVQMFSHAIDMSPDFRPLCINQGLVYDIDHGHMPGATTTSGNNPPQAPSKYPVTRLHTGFAWAARRETITGLGGLMEFCILGSADNHMSKALFGLVETTLNRNLSEEYKAMCRTWQDRCDRYVQRNVGYVAGTINHFFHGSKKFRQYKERWHILVDNAYTPSTDTKKDWNGILQLTEHKITLRDQCRSYMRQRNEDSIDV